MNRYEIDQHAVDGSSRTPLAFIEQPIGKNQARLRDRVQLVPDIDLAVYECRAVVDWVDLRFHLVRATQGLAINSHLRKELGRSIHAKEEVDNQTFRLRVQEPTAKFLDRLVAAMSAKWGSRGEPDVMGMEISVDFRPRVHSVEALERLFGVLVRTHRPSRDVLTSSKDRPRSGWRTGNWQHARPVLPVSDSKVTRRLLAVTTANNLQPILGASYYAGAKDSRCMWRIMIKEVDQQNIVAGTRKELPKEEHRVRIEVTLDFRELHRLGINTIGELQTFRFQTFQGEYFQFKLPTFRDVELDENSRHSTRAIEACRRMKFLRAGVVGLAEMDEAFSLGRNMGRAKLQKKLGRTLARRKRTGTGSSSTLVAYEAPTSKVAMALRNLGSRMRRDEAASDPPRPPDDASASLERFSETKTA